MLAGHYMLLASAASSLPFQPRCHLLEAFQTLSATPDVSHPFSLPIVTASQSVLMGPCPRALPSHLGSL